MKIIKITAGKKIKFELIVDADGNQTVHILDGQDLGTRCNEIANAILPQDGFVSHNHLDWDKAMAESQREPVKENEPAKNAPQRTRVF